MYAVTFYSFKGGVGRSMALANVAHELLSRGKRVLLVDFDLEAPGLDTLARSSTRATTPGVVEYVNDYLRSDESPEAAKYLYESDTGTHSTGKLWVMPAGARDAGYSDRLNSINWGTLYTEHDGYVMLEDLKAQWASA